VIDLLATLVFFGAGVWWCCRRPTVVRQVDDGAHARMVREMRREGR
jgi:hypothetical protein